tara:strand:+ start:122 stop:412 length:291 start_codon:yes stop_codon:yes gene_type:complete
MRNGSRQGHDYEEEAPQLMASNVASQDIGGLEPLLDGVLDEDVGPVRPAVSVLVVQDQGNGGQERGCRDELQDEAHAGRPGGAGGGIAKLTFFRET